MTLSENIAYSWTLYYEHIKKSNIYTAYRQHTVGAEIKSTTKWERE